MARSPLFDIYDPLGAFQQNYELGLMPGQDEEIDPIGLVPIRRKPTISDLMPEEEKRTMLRSLAEMGTSGLGTLGYIMDTPGALVRGILAGKPLSVFGTSDERVDGRELLRQYGLAGKDDNWGNFSAGLGAEVLLDPMTYGTFGLSALLGSGARTAASRAAKAAGLMRNVAIDSVDNLNPLRRAANLAEYVDDTQLPRTREYLRRQTARGQLNLIDDPVLRRETRRRLFDQYRQAGLGPEALDEPLAALAELRLPGMKRGLDINGGAFGDWVAQNADAAANWTRTAPVIGHITRTGAALFDGRVGGLSSLDRDLDLTNDVQMSRRRAAAEAEDLQRQVLRERTRQQIAAMGAQVPDQIPAGVPVVGGQAIPNDLRQFNSRQLWNALQDYADSPDLAGPTLTGAPLGRTSGNPVADWVMENVPEFREIRDSFVDLGPEAMQDAAQAGLPSPAYRSIHGGGFFPRQLYWWQRERPPVRPGAQTYREKPWARDQRLFSTQDNFGRQRDPAYDIEGGNRTFRALTGNSNPNVDSAALQQALIGADEVQARAILDNVFRMGLGQRAPYQQAVDVLQRTPEYVSATPARQAEMMQALQTDIGGRYRRLADLLRSADTQFAQNNVGIFDSPSWNNAVRYQMGQATNVANSNELFNQLVNRADDTPAAAIQGGVNIPLAEAAERLGFDPQNFAQRWQAATGYDPTNYSINTRYLNALRTLMPETQLAQPERGLMKLIDSFTSAFKVGALASPAFHVRNAYSGATSAAQLGAFNPLDFAAAFQASGGNYRALGRRLRNAFGYSQLATDEERARRFLEETGAQRIASGNILDDIPGSPNQTVKALFTGADNQLDAPAPSAGWRDWLNNFFSMRGVGILDNAPAVNTNPLLRFNDRVGQRVEDMLRTGTFLNQVRKGVAPEVAGDLTRMAQVDYSPSAFSSFERNFLKRVAPFYSFQKGILPSIAENLIHSPGGMQSNLIRAITRGTQPSEDNFIPEYLRSSAAIPLPEGMPSIFGGTPKEGLQRYLTNIDLPFESTLNLFTPGSGTTLWSRISDTARKTGSNLLGQTNPLIKGPLEWITNRQLYSGRNLDDLYSVLERDLGEIGRPIEQAAVNFVPFGARGLGLYRQLTDERLPAGDRLGKAAWNLLAGAKLTDIDQERTKRLAAREMLNKLLQTTPGVKTYENITVPDDVLRAMAPEQQQMYLLYRVIQAEAAKRARDKKKAETALDPLELLGVVQSPR